MRARTISKGNRLLAGGIPRLRNTATSIAFVALTSAHAYAYPDPSRQESNSNQLLNCVQFEIDGQRGWAVGWAQNGFGIVITTADGGNTWASQLNHTTVQCLDSVQFEADGQRGWAVGMGGAVIVTVDGGKTWVAHAIPAPPAMDDSMRIRPHAGA
jgi:photosystem II stability/assembly factor-like uncharacterized protein